MTNFSGGGTNKDSGSAKNDLTTPPAILIHLLKGMCVRDLKEGFVGDIEQEFSGKAERLGRKKALLWLGFLALLSIPGYIRRVIFWSCVMLNNYFKTAWRNIKRHKGFSLINITSLTVGIACCILIFLFIHDEKTYDRFHEKIDRIHYMMGHVDLGFATIGDPPAASLAPRLMDEFPEVETAVRIKREKLVLKTGNQGFDLSGLSVDPSFFKMFTFPLADGVSGNAIEGRFNIILSADTARLLYGGRNPGGQTVSLRVNDEWVDFIVSGVTLPFPHNSSLRFDFIINIRSIHGELLTAADKSVPTFLLLTDRAAKDRLIKKFPATIDRELSKRFNGKGRFHLESLAGFHLNEESAMGVLTDKGSLTSSYILSGIALLILMISCFNYVNLSTGSIAGRFKEVGIRKVLGAQKRQIQKQFLFESFMTGFFSLVCGVGLSAFLIPVFNSLVNKKLTLIVFCRGFSALFLILLTCLAALLAGLYPSFLMSRFPSVLLLKGKLRFSGKNIFSRSLIVFQFVISVFLITGAIFLYLQQEYMLNRDLGYNVEKVIRVNLDKVSSDAGRNRLFFTNFKNRILEYPAVKEVSGAVYSLSSSWMRWFIREENRLLHFDLNYVDHDYLDALDLRLVRGRNFVREFPSDTRGSALVNEQFVTEMGLESPIGTNMDGLFKEPTVFDGATITGIVRDFHYRSMSEKICPAVLLINSDDFYKFVYVRFTGGVRETLDILKKEHRRLTSHIPFEYTFLDEQVARQYQKEKKWRRIISLASFFAVAKNGSRR
jgi:putative ABC transport system permease protein